MATGQLFSKTTQALFYNYKQLPIQRMLDFDFLCGRETPSVAGIINPGSEGFQKLFFGQEEIAIPVHSTIEAACAAHPTADVFINFASFRSAAASSMAALKQPTIKVVAIIAEGVPESDTKQLIAYARANNKVVIGPATVGGIQAGAFKIGDTAGTIDNIIQCKLYRPGSVGFVSKSGGMSNEMYNTIARVTDGIYEGIAIGGDVFPGSTLSDHVIRFNNIPQVFESQVYSTIITSATLSLPLSLFADVEAVTMAFWWPLLVFGIAYAICRFLLMLIPPNVPSIDVDVSDVVDDGSQNKDNSFIYIPTRGRQTDKVQCYEPATMKYLGFFPALKPDEVRERVAQARKAQKIWAKSSFKQRRQFLRILLKYIIEHQELICEISSRDTGKTMIDASLGEIMTTCEKITWLLSEGEKWLKPEYRSSGRSMLHKTSKVEFHPLGVIGAIVSWNYPFHNIFNPMLAAVFSGNGIVIKVSEHASWSGCFYFRIIQTALAAVGAPENLVDVITGFAETGEALVSSVDKIIFVGSPGVGKKIMRKASEMLIPVTLELGGKDPFIVCEDVDVEHVAQIAVRASLQSSGQNCAGAERFYVHRDIYNAFVAQVVKIVKSVTAGPPLAGRYDMGAICMQDHAEKLQSLVNDALDKGAEIVGRGRFGNLGTDAVDQFFPPTVLVNVNHTMQIMQEEAFGPIMPIMKFNSDEEVISLANDSRYGLGCAVFSGNQSRARTIASQLHCGVAAINDFASNYMCQSLPFGGVKDSGFGRFAGIEGLRACCLVKSVVEDRWWPYVKTKIPKPIQYPVAENAFEFQQSLVEALYGLNIWDRLRALVNVIKVLTDQTPTGSGSTKRND